MLFVYCIIAVIVGDYGRNLSLRNIVMVMSKEPCHRGRKEPFPVCFKGLPFKE